MRNRMAITAFFLAASLNMFAGALPDQQPAICRIGVHYMPTADIPTGGWSLQIMEQPEAPSAFFHGKNNSMIPWQQVEADVPRLYQLAKKTIEDFKASPIPSDFSMPPATVTISIQVGAEGIQITQALWEPPKAGTAIAELIALCKKHSPERTE